MDRWTTTPGRGNSSEQPVLPRRETEREKMGGVFFCLFLKGFLKLLGKMTQRKGKDWKKIGR